ncbi:hypothetical protein I4U23_012124 [Adineta vaga]|nr:hypothetical protein I4U23_012124 [Adineta vaga]
MSRRCNSCHGITPSTKVNFCPHCGKQFSTWSSHRTTLATPSFTRSSSTVKHERRPTAFSDSVHTRVASSSSSFSRRSGESGKYPSISSRSCLYESICAEYLLSLHWQEHFFDRTHDRCYCNHCYSESQRDTIETGGSIYVLPRGWCRFGLRVDDVLAKVNRIWNEWIVTYHGTSPDAAQSVVIHRQFLVPGDRRIDGLQIEIHEGHIPGKCHIYTSPTIAYSSHPVYCPKQRFRSKLTNKLYDARIVLQCRQKPESFLVQGETINAGQKRLCPFIPNEKIEIFTTVRASIVVYGILIHLSEV